jgi:hypothetical protein
MAACPKCEAPCADDAQFCAKCGAVVGPDAGALERLIDERARQIVAEEKAQERDEKERVEREEQRKRERENLVTQLADARKALDDNKAEPDGILGACLKSTKRVLVTAAIAGVFPGVFVHLFLLPAFGRSPASYVCPQVCNVCTAPARTFSWNYKGSWHSENGQMGFAFVCTNPVIDIEKLTVTDLWDDKTNADLQPFMLNSLAVFLAEYAVLVPISVLVLGPYFGIRRRRRALAQTRPLEEALARAQQRLDAFDKPAAESAEPYR